MIGACPFPTPQGSQVYMGSQARALAEAGVDLTLLTYGHGEGRVKAPYRHLPLPRLPGYARLRSGPDPVKPLLDLGLLARLLSLPADLYHAHNYEAGLIALAASRRSGVPVLYDAHGLLREELPSYRESGGALLAGLGGLVDGRLAKAQGVLAISRLGYEEFRKLGARRVVLSPPGVDPQEMEGGVPRRGEGPTVVYAGNPDRYQDLPLLLQAIEELPGVTLRIVSFTEEWEAVLAPFPRLRVERVRPRNWAEARDWIAGAQVAALPRRRCPGFPIKLLDYLGLGVPTVVCTGSAQGLPGEVVVEPEHFADGLRRVLETGGPRDFRRRFLEENAWTVRAGTILEVYRSLC